MFDLKDTPAWVNWVVPFGVIGAALMWVIRVFIMPSFKKQLEELLEERFELARQQVEERAARAREEMNRRHAENKHEIELVREELRGAAKERKALQKQIAEISGYLAGKSSGAYQKLKGDE